MNTFEFFKQKLDHEISHSIRAQLWLQEPSFIQDCMDFDDMEIWCGISRACIVAANWDFVVKFTYLEDARGDACERECNAYENAVDSGLEKYFAKPKYVGRYEWRGEGYSAREIFRDLNIDFDGDDEDILENIEEEGFQKKEISIYLDLYEYPKVETKPLYYTPSKEVETKVKRSGSSFAQKNTFVAAYFVEKYGYEEFMKIADFLEWNEINDLHSGNIGYIGDRIIFIDYAGYYDPDEDSYSN